ncbi:MAG: hypothetical protein P1S60_09920 [Anaerolineae bacterium]|nr:hypothetical protein [Anaerolineae bacterium]
MMNPPTVIRTFTFDDEDTCKFGWEFTLTRSVQGWIIDDLQIQEREKHRGCSGHPKTIVALIKGRPLLSLIDLGLVEASCNRSLSCGQAPAICIKSLIVELS